MSFRFRHALMALFLGVLLVAGSEVARATEVSTTEFTCGFCGKKFADQIIWSTNVMDWDVELRPYAMGLDPLPYYVHTCPYCGYTDGGDRFQLNDWEKAEIGKFLADYRQSHGDQVHQTGKYEVLANIYLIRKMPSDKIAYAYQRAAWLADDARDEAAARKFRIASLEYLTKALEKSEIEAKMVPNLTYLAGELSRRLGRFDGALQWFARVKPTGPNLETLVAQQTELARQKDARADRMPALR